MSAALHEQLAQALVAFSGTTRLYELTIGSSTDLLVEAFRCDDAIQEVGMRKVVALATDAHIDVASLLEQPATLAISLADGCRMDFSGIVVEAALLASDGGFARYALTIAPWLWRLDQVRNCRVWENRSVMEIVDEVFRAYQPQARWRWSSETPAFVQDGVARSYCCQYRETDLAFVRRLLTEEGLCWRVEQDDDGACCVLFADSTQLCAVPEDPSSAQDGGVRYHGVRPGESQDTVQAMHAMRGMLSTSVTVLSTDYKTRHAITATSHGRIANGADIPALEVFDNPGAYAYTDPAQARRYADLHMETLEARSLVWQGRSTVRTLRAGTRLRVTGMAIARLGTAPAFTVVKVRSIGVNNLPPPATLALAELFGPVMDVLVPATDTAGLTLVQAVASGYANWFEAIPAARPWRAPLPDAAPGRHPHATAHGPQTAIVVGADGGAVPGASELYCDRLGRVRIRFHWQGESSGCWVRVAQRAAGSSKSQFLPRIGQEVVVQFMENNIDRPVIAGAVYNGQGEGGIYATPGGADGRPRQTELFQRAHDHGCVAQGNLLGTSSPVWHGASPDSTGHRNAAAQWGIRSKEWGGSGYNQLVFDDTDAQGRIQLKCTSAATELNLGHLIHTADNYRGSFRGLGAELRTDAYGAVRAGAGLLVSSYPIRHGASERDPAGENAAGVASLKQAAQLAASFHEAACTHRTVGLGAHAGTSTPLKTVLAALSGRVDRDGKPVAEGAEGSVPHVAEPVIAIAAQGGLGASAGQDLQLSSGATIALISGGDAQFATGGQARVHAGQALGILGGAVKPGAGGIGLQLVAAQDAIDFQAQAGTLAVQARDDVKVISANAHIDWAAAKSISVSTVGGANITIDGGNITVQCPGKLTIRAGVKRFEGPAKASFKLPVLPISTIVPAVGRTLESTFAFDQLTLVAKNFTKAEFVMFVVPVFGYDIPADTYIKLWEGLRNGAIAQPVLKLMSGGHYPASFDNDTRQILVHQAAADRAASDNDESWELLTALLHEFGHYIDLVLRTDLATKNGDGRSVLAADAPGDEGAKFAYGIAFYDFSATSETIYATYVSPKFTGALKVNYSAARKAIQASQDEEAQRNEGQSGNVEHFGAGRGEHYKDRPNASFGHQSIEAALENASRGFTKSILKKIYFGNWLRDYSQLVDPAIVRKPEASKDFPRKMSRKSLTQLADIFAEIDFVEKSDDKKLFTVTEELLGVYRPVEHIDNPKNNTAGAPDPQTIDKEFQPNATGEYFHIDWQESMIKYIIFSKRYMEDKIAEAVRKGPTVEGFRDFGAALHVLEDYFAHSNYVELILRKVGYREVLVWTTPASCKRSLPVVTGMFSSDDVVASTAGLIADILFKVEWNFEEIKPGERTKADRVMLILLEQHSDQRLLKSYKDYLNLRDELAKIPGHRYLKLAMHYSLGLVANTYNWVFSTLIHLVGNSVDDEQILQRGDPNTTPMLYPSHSQLAKDHDSHPFHVLAATLASDAVVEVGKAMAARWWSSDLSADPVSVAGSFIVHPFDTDRQDLLVKNWALKHPAQVTRGTSATEWEALEKAHKKEILNFINSRKNKLTKIWGYVSENYQSIFGNQNQIKK